MLTALAILCLLAPFSLLGVLIVFHIARPQRRPADTSNRINKARLLWFALTREDLFVGTFPWLTRDEADNVGGKR